MPKVLRIINRFNLGGPTYNATYLSAFLPERYETKLIGGTHEAEEGSSTFIPEKYGVDFEIVDELQRAVNVGSDRKALKRVREIIREYQPDIVHTHASKAGAIGRMAAFKEKVPIVVHTFHGHVFHSYFGPLKTAAFKAVERKLARKTTAIIAISPQQKKELSEIHKIAEADKFRVVPLGFDLGKFQENKEAKREAFRQEYNLDNNTVAVALIGRLTAIKNHEWFIQVIKQIADQTEKRFRVFIIGDGELMDPLKTSADEVQKSFQNHENLFQFTSWIKNIDEILPGLDVVALSSLNEGTPVSLIEAQAAGVPVISTNVGGVRDVVDDGNTGFIIDDFSTEDYVQKLRRLIEDEELRKKMSQNGWNHVQEKYHYTRLCEDVTKLYDELLSKEGR